MDDIKTTLSETGAPMDRPQEIFDARSLPPPQPLKNTLERLIELNDDTVLIQRNDRAPQHLYPKLDQRGYQHETIENPDEVVTIIWRG